MMKAKSSFLLPLLILLASIGSSTQEAVSVSINSVTTIGKTDNTFVCATLDWWPPTKCNYGMCPWGNSSMLNLNIDNTIFVNAIKAFKNMRIRLGGSLQDQVLYKVGDYPHKCGHSFKEDEDGLFGFSKGCLPMRRWDKLNSVLGGAGAILTFGLNALNGRMKATNDSLYVGNWDPSNARDFINYTISKGYKIESWELGNELCGTGISARVEAKQYGKDLITLKGVIDQLYQNSSIPRPKILAPGGFFDAKWFNEMLQTSGPRVLDVVTHHIYNLGSGADPDLPSHILNGSYLDNTVGTYKDVETTLRNFGPWASAWVGESGGAYNSGGVASHTFINSFWYLDQLGMTSSFGHTAFCRQTLIGGNYGLLNTTTFIPNPDYYSALLWHRLMGPGVLETSNSGPLGLRSYSHCSRDQPGVTLLVINLSNSTSYNVTITDKLNMHPVQPKEGQGQREEYHLTPKEGDVLSEAMLLNGQPLNITSAGEIPDLNPVFVSASDPLLVAPHSIVFFRMKDFTAPACA